LYQLVINLLLYDDYNALSLSSFLDVLLFSSYCANAQHVLCWW